MADPGRPGRAAMTAEVVPAAPRATDPDLPIALPGPSGARSRGPTVAVLVWVLVALTGAYGVILRIWLLGHLVLNSDEAVSGLMGRAIGAGHVNTFYWGQQYGGVEPYVVAAVLRVVNDGPMGLNGTAAALGLVAVVVVGWAVAGSTGSRPLGALAGALAWVWPYAVVWNGVRESGLRQAVLCCGVVLVLCALRVQRGAGRRATGGTGEVGDPGAGGVGWATYAVMGLAGGLGWWASPEIVYFAVPAAVLLVASWDRLFATGHRLDGRWRWGPVALTVAGAVVGALPWIYTNVGTGFASLQSSSLPDTTGLDYGQRLSVFFHDMLPIQLGVRAVPGGAWVGGPGVGRVLYGLLAAVVLVALARCLLAARHGRRAAPLLAAAAAVVAFPFLYAKIPASGYWVDGRYGVTLPSLLVLLLAFALAGPPRRAVGAAGGVAPARVSGPRHARGGPARSPARRGAGGLPPVVGSPALLAGCAGLVVGACLTVGTARAGGVPATPGSFFSGWRDPNTATRQVVAGMEAHGIRYAYGDYWTAYVLDFLDPTGVSVSPSPDDVVRWPAMAAAVAAAPRQAWLFFAPGHTAAAYAAFGDNPEPGPGGFTEARFTGWLEARHVPYKVVHLGVLDAVVPAHKVTLPG